MMGRAAARGQNFSGRFLWRLSILFLFGFLHSLIYRGDILTLYVAIGFILPLFYRISTRALWTLVALLFLGIGRYLFLAITGTDTFLDYQNTPDSPQVAAYVDILKNGSFSDVIRENFVHGFASKFDYLFGIYGRAYLTLGYFLVGMWLVRTGILHRLQENRALLKRVLIWSLGLTPIWALCFIGIFSVVPQPLDFKTWPPNIGYGFYDFFNISLTAAMISGFLLLCLRRPGGAFPGLAAYGRMALSCYLTQSVIGVLIFHGWALGMLGRLHDWQTLLLALVVVALQIQVCKWWLARFSYGPLEWLWRSATYFRRIELKRSFDSKSETV